MRKILIIAMTIAIALIPLTGEAKKKKEIKKNNPFGEFYPVPTSEIDTEEYFGATGIAYGPLEKMGEVQINSLDNAQTIIRMKMKHAYKGVISDYSNTISNNMGTNMESKLERAGDRIIDAIVNDTQASKEPTYSLDDKGNVTFFTTVRVYKKEFADKVSKYVSEDEELKLQFKEEQFRKRMEETLKKYKEEKQ